MSNTKSLNVWDYKPWWCQPWSILLTGIIIIAASWFPFQKIWLVVGVSFPILVWWVYFLIIYPKLVQQALIASQQPIKD
jgi:membrane protein YdbS with pleckstrin-like domain